MFDDNACREHEYIKCLLRLPGEPALVGSWELAQVCRKCGFVNTAEAEVRFVKAEGPLYRFADAGDYGDLPTVELDPATGHAVACAQS